MLPCSFVGYLKICLMQVKFANNKINEVSSWFRVKRRRQMTKVKPQMPGCGVRGVHPAF